VLKLRKRVTGSNLVDMGWGAVHNHSMWVVDSVAGLRRRWGGHGERLRRRRGDTAGAELGAKLIDRFAVNTGTIPHRSRSLEPIQVVGIDASFVEDAGWGGGSVVVRAHERCVHGEESQQVGSGSAGMPGARW
jgi:hypothetical protein